MKLLERIRGPARRDPRHGREIPRKIRKAVLPVAGLGTRFLPVTKSLPKEMLPIVDRPLIQYAVDEALAAGMRELIFITHRSKRAIQDYFDRALEMVVGRYIFTPRFLECLDRLHPGANNEIQLTDGIARLLGQEPVFAHRFVGTRYDCGSKIGYLEATLAFAAKHPARGAEFRTLLTAAARRLQPPIVTANSPPQLTLVSD